MTHDVAGPSVASAGSGGTIQPVVGATDAAGKADCKSGNGAAVALRVSAESGLMPCVRDTGFAPRGWVGSRVGIRPPQCCEVMRRVARASNRMRRRTGRAKHCRRNLVSGKYTWGQNASDQRPATAGLPVRQTESRVRCIAWL